MTTPGTAGTVIEAEEASVIVPFERTWLPEELVIPGGTRLAIGLEATLNGGSGYSMSSVLDLIEI